MIANILFFGSSEYSLKVLNTIHKCFPINLAVTQPDKPVGRGKKLEPSIVKTGAESISIPVIQPSKINDELLWKALDNYAIDLILVAAYGKILPKTLLQKPKFGCVNVHASLLPRWRGASPIQAAILNGDKETGVTIMKMDEGIDTGPILNQRMLKIESKETSETLGRKLADLGSELLIETLPRYLDGEINAKVQGDDGATYSGLIKKADGLMDFKCSASYLERKIRALNPWPICYMKFEETRLRILNADVSGSSRLSESERGIVNGYPSIGTSTNDLILTTVQPSGKKIMDGKAFLNGARNWLN